MCNLCAQHGAELSQAFAAHLLHVHLGVGVRFDYQDPEQGFDRSKVKGVVAKLVRLQEPATTTALEVAAGGKLYQVPTILLHQLCICFATPASQTRSELNQAGV